ncbi:hypothetical protein ABEB36_014784 [Hypothenemus hampei]|uniref:Uncharacterized protein n=1 Tax=Hypothenemus hampei TaxID=57062 RepID=A0ABD1E354_HYPHA
MLGKGSKKEGKKLELKERELDKKERELKDLETKVGNLPIQLAEQADEPKQALIITNYKAKTREIATQTSDMRVEKSKAKNNTYRLLEAIDSYADFKAKCENKSPEEFKSTELIIGNPLHTEDEVVKDRYPELGLLQGDLETLEQCTKTKTGAICASRKIIKARYDGSREKAWEALQGIKAETKGTDKIAIHHLEEIDLKLWREMIEAIFFQSGTKVLVYTTKQKMKTKESEMRTGQGLAKAKTNRQTAAVVVEATKETYKEALTAVKNILKINNVGDGVQELRSTREGKLLIVMRNEQEVVKEVETAINKAGAQYKAKEVEKERRKPPFLLGE